MHHSEPTAVYRTKDGTREVAIFCDGAECSPLACIDWFTFLAKKDPRYRHGHEQMELDDLDERIREADQAGHLVLDVYLTEHSALAFSLGHYGDRSDSRRCGVLIVTKREAEARGMNGEDLRQELTDQLKLYECWVNGWGFRYEEYALATCDLGEVHRTLVAEGRDYLGVDHAETAILVDAGVARPKKQHEPDDDWNMVRG